MPRTLTAVALTLICAACALAQVAEPIDFGPPPVEELAAEAQRLYDQWRWDELKAISLRMVTHYPESAESWYWRGVAQNREEENAEARVAYGRALELDPEMLRAQKHLVGIIRATDGREAQQDAARELADHCAATIAQDPENRDAHWARAWALYWLDDLAGAREELQQVVEMHPEDAEALRDLGFCACWALDLEDGVRLLERSVEERPDDIEAMVGLSTTYMNLRRHHDALAIAERVKRVNPMETEGYRVTGTVLAVFLDDLDAGLAQLDIALALRPDRANLWSTKANLIRIAGDPSDALAILDEAAAAGIGLEELHVTRGNCYRAAGRSEDALDEYSAAIEDDAESGLAYWLRARLYIELERWEEAWADVQRAEELGQDVSQMRQQLLEHMPEPEREG